MKSLTWTFPNNLQSHRRKSRHFPFQQDGDMPHFSDKLVQFIHEMFRNRQFQMGGANSWPTAESDLTPLDLFLLWEARK